MAITLTTSYQKIFERRYYYGPAWKNNWFDEYLYAKYISQDEATNTTKVQVEWVYDCRYGDTWQDAQMWHKTWTPAGSSNNPDLFNNGWSIPKTGKTKVHEGSIITLRHDNDGTYSKTWNWSISNVWSGGNDSGTISNVTLPRIIRFPELYVSPTIVEKNENLIIRTECPADVVYQTIGYEVNGHTEVLHNKEKPTLSSEGNYIFEDIIPYSTLINWVGQFTSSDILVMCESYYNTTDTTPANKKTKKCYINNGVIPMSWVDNQTGGVGVTIGEKALAGDYFFATILDTYLGKSTHRITTHLEDTAFSGNFVEVWPAGGTTPVEWDDYDMYSAYLIYNGTTTFIIPRGLENTSVNGVEIDHTGDTGKVTAGSVTKVFGIK